MTMTEYKQFLIHDILEWTDKFTREQLEKKEIRELEIIYDYC